MKARELTASCTYSGAEYRVLFDKILKGHWIIVGRKVLLLECQDIMA